MTHAPTIPCGGDVGHVPARLPPVDPPPPAPRHVNFWAALALFWILPRRYGPHLAAAPFGRALAAHLLSLVAAATVVGIAVMARMTTDVPDLSRLRLFLAEGVLHLAAWSTVGAAWIPPAVLLAVVPGLLVLAIAAMPWAAGGDPLRSVFRRSIKNLYWSTTVLIPAALVFALVFLVVADMPSNARRPPGTIIVIGRPRFDWPQLEQTGVETIVMSLVPLALLALRCVLVGASCYVGPPVGPGFEPREPRCDACGYPLIGLLESGRCPECGEPIAASLTNLRRDPALWDPGRLDAGWLRRTVSLHDRVLRDPRFARTLPVHGTLALARRVWHQTYILFLLAGTILTAIYVALASGSDRHPGVVFVFAPFVLAALPALQTASVVFASIWGALRLGIRDLRISMTVAYAAAPHLWPLIPLFLFTTASIAHVSEWQRVPPNTFEVSAGTVISLIGLSLGILALHCRHLVRALRDVRFANV